MLPFCDRVVSTPRKDIRPVWRRSWPISKAPQTIGEHLRKKRFELNLRQSQVAHKLGVSERTLSLWECDEVYPRWKYHCRLIKYLGHDPFPSCGLQDPYSNETTRVAYLTPETIGGRIRMRRLELRLTVKQCARKLKVTAKTLYAWERQRHQPARGRLRRLIQFLGADVWSVNQCAAPTA
jgi:transcriptional regulator with XRE-family HTH domain